MRVRLTMLALATTAVLLARTGWADDQPAPPSTAPAATPSPPPFPAMAGVLSANTNPPSFDLGLIGRNVTVTAP